MPTLSIFPKFLRPLALDDLGPRLRDAGIDAVNLVVREGFWVEPGDEAAGIPRFAAALRSAGLTVPFCTLCRMPAELVADPTPLQVLADHGIRRFRLGYFRLNDDPLSAQLRTAQGELAALGPLLDRHDLRAVYQVHHGTLVPSGSCAALLVEGLDPARFGVMLDAGNMGFEGLENWDRCRRILGTHWSSLGVKDTRVERIDGRPKRRFCPCPEGDQDWTAIGRAWAGNPGREHGDPWVLMPFYHEDDVDALLATLAEEVTFMRRHLAEAEASTT